MWKEGFASASSSNLITAKGTATTQLEKRSIFGNEFIQSRLNCVVYYCNRSKCSSKSGEKKYIRTLLISISPD